MSAAVKVVSQAECETVAEVLFNAKVHLLRVGINKPFALRIAERLESKREESGRVQVILIGKQTGVECIEPLFVWQVSGNRGKARSCIQNSLENIRRVQAGGTRGNRWVARTSAGKQQLAALRTIGGVTQEGQPEHRMVEKSPVRP